MSHLADFIQQFVKLGLSLCLIFVYLDEHIVHLLLQPTFTVIDIEIEIFFKIELFFLY